MSENLPRVQIVPLPSTVEDMLSRRKTAANRTLNSYVDEIHVKLWSDYSEKPDALGQRYRKLLDAVYDEQAVEGSLSIDNAEAARMIRDYARARKELDYVAGQKLASIVKSLSIVLKRYRMTRKERAVRIYDEDVTVGPEESQDVA